MKSRFINRMGEKYGRLTPLERYRKNKRNEWEWLCRCDCGQETFVSGSNLGNGNTRSCGCLGYHAEGMSNSLIYKRWSTMKNKCYNIKSYNYARFGGRGIKVCPEWKDSFVTFYKDMGDSPEGHQLARKNTDKNFSKDNCFWATPKEAHDKNLNAKKHIIEFNGKFKTVTEWAKLMNLPAPLIFSRLRNGWTPFKALMTPVHKKPSKKGAE